MEAIIIIWTFFALMVGWIGAGNSLGFWNAFLLSLMLSPLVGFIICLFYPSNATVKKRQKITSIGVADELKKLNDLKNENLITEAEFQAQKSKLLGK